VIRTFYTVGQGAFYTEKFNNGFTVVYDCGGQNKRIIKNKIKQEFNKNEKIDILFISHFHGDHINGLEFLLTYCDVKRVILPLLEDDMKLQFFIENNSYYRYQNSFLKNLILNPKDSLKNQEITFVEPYDTKIDIDISNLNTIKSGELLHSSYTSEWIYVTYNMYNNSFSKDLQKELTSIGVDISNIENKLTTNKINIINKYKSVIDRGGFNANSLVVFSGFRNHANCNITSSCKFLCQEVVSKKNGCLYLGDFEAKEDDSMQILKSVFHNYWDNISVVQIPHHGSYKNYHTELSWSESISVISTGFRYSHPSSKVIEDIKSNNSYACIVSQHPNSEVSQYINLEIILEKDYTEYLI